MDVIKPTRGDHHSVCLMSIILFSRRCSKIVRMLPLRPSRPRRSVSSPPFPVRKEEEGPIDMMVREPVERTVFMEIDELHRS